MPTVLFSRDNAREFAARGNAKRWSKEHRDIVANGPPLPKPASIATESDVDPFIDSVIRRVRKQIDSVLKMLETEKDPAAYDKLTRSLGALCEQEQILTMRPKPGPAKSSRQTRQRSARPSPKPSEG